MNMEMRDSTHVQTPDTRMYMSHVCAHVGQHAFIGHIDTYHAHAIDVTCANM